MNEPDAGTSVGGNGTGGKIGAGGSVGAGGMIGGIGGMTTGYGGAFGAGGMLGAGGITAGAGGMIGTGGMTGTGGKAGAGGMTTGAGGSGTGGSGAGGKTGAGGMTSIGGATGSGGMIVTSIGGATGSGGMTGVGGATGLGGTTGAGGAIVVTGPCDVLGAAGNTCVAAHSTVRALYGKYTGPLYQVCKGVVGAGPNYCLTGTTLDIGTVAGGYADSASQDVFCAGATCTISIIYDQSPNGNNLKAAPAGGAKGTPDSPANATDIKTTLNAHPVYGVLIKATVGYRAGCTACGVVIAKGTATGDTPETEYMVTSQNGLVNGCCFDYGNAETDSHDDGNGTAEALFFGTGVVWDSGAEGGHNIANPWVMVDLENGLFAGFTTAVAPSTVQTITSNTALHFNFVTAAVVGDAMTLNAGMGRFALYGGDATAGVLKTMYDGIRPTITGYVPMKKQGGIVLGTAGDNSDSGGGQFFEGVMASGAASLTTLNALQANIVAAKYGQ